MNLRFGFQTREEMSSCNENFVISSVVFQSDFVAPNENVLAMSGAGFGFEFAGKSGLRE